MARSSPGIVCTTAAICPCLRDPLESLQYLGKRHSGSKKTAAPCFRAEVEEFAFELLEVPVLMDYSVICPACTVKGRAAGAFTSTSRSGIQKFGSVGLASCSQSPTPSSILPLAFADSSASACFPYATSSRKPHGPVIRPFRPTVSPPAGSSCWPPFFYLDRALSCTLEF